ncbi:hypothetical protein KCP78_23135 [Salmonella enterica subsp. enterica]|nr:hypothetical protein KCP78_23135 [Salmonella enterica subsp. enterica]
MARVLPSQCRGRHHRDEFHCFNVVRNGSMGIGDKTGRLPILTPVIQCDPLPHALLFQNKSDPPIPSS